MNAAIYKNNRQKLIKSLPDASMIIIVGNGLIQRSGDTAFWFKQESSMLYFTGCNVPSSYLLIDCIKNKSYIVLPNRTRFEILFDDSENIIELASSSGVDGVIFHKEALQIIKNIKIKEKLYANVESPVKQYGVFSNPFKTQIKQLVKRYGIQYSNVMPAVADLRVIKQNYEVKAIKKAISLTHSAIKSSLPKIGQSEKDVADVISANFFTNHVNHGYEPIVAFNKNAAILHHSPSSDVIYAKSNSVLLDVGAEYCGYSADISRTFASDNKTALIVDSVTNVQQQLISWLKPGKSWQQFHKLAVKLLEEQALKLDLISKKEPISLLFPHAIGHFLGLDVHDIGDYKKPLSENMVITVEPGLYSKKQGFGVRIEDDVLITKNGAVVL